MRNAIPERWIEQAEARRVITTALFERAAKAPWSAAAEHAKSQWLPRLGTWLAGRHPMGLTAPQPQPALVCSRPAAQPHDEDAYSGDR